jgi:hypothetical protein
MQGRRLRQVAVFPAGQQLQQELDALNIAPNYKQLIQAALPLLPQAVTHTLVNNAHIVGSSVVEHPVDDDVEMLDVAEVCDNQAAQTEATTQVEHAIGHNPTTDTKTEADIDKIGNDPWLHLSAVDDSDNPLDCGTKPKRKERDQSRPCWLDGCIRRKRADLSFTCCVH